MESISLEREMSFYKGKRIANKREIKRVANRFKEEIEGIGGIDVEVSRNTLEMKFPFLKREEIAKTILKYRKKTDIIAKEENLRVEWGNQKNYSGEINHFFTTRVIKDSIELFKDLNSLHLHLEVSEENAIKLYRQLNVVGIYYLVNSSVSRLHKTKNFLEKYKQLVVPEDIRSMGDFREYLAVISRMFQNEFNKLSKEERIEIMREYPENFRDGKIWVEDDKVFSIARIRESLRLKNGNISLEFRGIDAQIELYDEMKIVLSTIRLIEELLNSIDLMSIIGIKSIYEFYDKLGKGVVDLNNDAYLLSKEFIEG